MKGTLLYLHGFASGSRSQKGTLLQKHFSAVTRVLTPDLGIDPAQVLSRVQTLLDQSPKPWLLVGSSLGGFYTHHFHAQAGIPGLSINPLVDPALLRPYLGIQKNLSSGEDFEFLPEHLEALIQLKARRPIPDPAGPPLRVLVASDDELLDPRAALEAYAQPPFLLRVSPWGGHRFSNEAFLLDQVSEALNELE